MADNRNLIRIAGKWHFTGNNKFSCFAPHDFVRGIPRGTLNCTNTACEMYDLSCPYFAPQFKSKKSEVVGNWWSKRELTCYLLFILLSTKKNNYSYKGFIDCQLFSPEIISQTLKRTFQNELWIPVLSYVDFSFVNNFLSVNFFSEFHTSMLVGLNFIALWTKFLGDSLQFLSEWNMFCLNWFREALLSYINWKTARDYFWVFPCLQKPEISCQCLRVMTRWRTFDRFFKYWLLIKLKRGKNSSNLEICERTIDDNLASHKWYVEISAVALRYRFTVINTLCSWKDRLGRSTNSNVFTKSKICPCEGKKILFWSFLHEKRFE